MATVLKETEYWKILFTLSSKGPYVPTFVKKEGHVDKWEIKQLDE